MMQQIMKKPEWLKIRPPTSSKYGEIKDTLNHYGLTTVCQKAHCPNISECWSGGTAVFMIMGNICTRACKFCSVKTGFPAKPLDSYEPKKIAAVISKWNLSYIVITSVDRDDLKDYGAGHFATCIKEIKKENPEVLIEVLIPDFKGDIDCLKKIIEAKPNVIGHNVETVKSLQRAVRDPRANYKQSLSVLENIKKINPKIYTKSSIMLGLGEKDKEVMQTLKDLRAVNVDIITLGQYLRPSDWNLEVKEYVHPDKFKYFKKRAEEMGFLYAASGPFVRSSYRAGELFIKNIIKKGAKQ